MSSLLGSKDSLSTAENEDFDSFDKIHLNKIQSHKISLPDLLNEFDEGSYASVLIKRNQNKLVKL